MKQALRQFLSFTANSQLALRRLRRWCPPEVLTVLRVLQSHGARAVIVGGVVRDAFLGRVGSDWDVATDALPEAVAGYFPRVVRAGEKHGTIMVLGQRGQAPVEVTTFRAEGPYLDGRRPAHVSFLADITADLARRDFTINAMAADFAADIIVDPFDGVGDLQRRRIRAVGDARLRFAEDGLRPMRAARFVAALNFSLEQQTLAALGSAQDVFQQVAWERKRDELEKLLKGPAVLAGIDALRQGGLLALLAPELAAESGGQKAVDLAAISALPANPWLRLSAWAALVGLESKQGEEVVQRLRGATWQRRFVGDVLAGLAALPQHAAPTGKELRAWLAHVGRERAVDIARVKQAIDPKRFGAFHTKVQRAVRLPHCLSTDELAVGGHDLLALGIQGPQVGQIQRLLLSEVLEKPAKNRKNYLINRAHSLSTGLENSDQGALSRS